VHHGDGEAWPATVDRFVARDGFDLTRLWAETEALDGKISGEMQNSIYEEISHSFVVLTSLLLKTGMTKVDMAEVISR
ncbi:hypothetical protein ACC736_39845, partial [Rhizobium ruizarguesonis]